LLTRLPSPSRSMVIANVHLTHLRDMVDLRRAQVTAVLQHRWFSAPENSARLLVGDLNTDLTELNGLFEQQASWSACDGYAAAHGPLPRNTVPVRAPREEGRCLDYILSLARDGYPHPSFEHARIVLDAPDGWAVYASDHRGVMVEVLDQ
jgi:endonuclease/exonuclease/phosphatase family metal-dependent hydrolase